MTSPTVTTKYWGNNHKIDTEFDVVTSTWNTVCNYFKIIKACHETLYTF